MTEHTLRTHKGELDAKSICKVAAAAAAKSLQSCPTMCDPIDGSPPGSSVLGFSRQESWSGLPFPSLLQSGGGTIIVFGKY